MSSQHTCTQQIQCLKKTHMCTTNMLLLHTSTSAHHVNWGIMCLSDKQQLQHPWDGINSGLSTCTSIKHGHIFVFIMFWVMDPWSHETLQASMTAVMFVSKANAGQCLWYSVITSLTSLQASLKGMHAVCAPASCSQSVGKLLPSIQWQSVKSFGQGKKRMAAMVSQIPLHLRLVFHLQLSWKCPDSMSRVLSGLRAVKVNMFCWQMPWHPDVTKRERERERERDCLKWNACCHTDLDFLSLSIL